MFDEFVEHEHEWECVQNVDSKAPVQLSVVITEFVPFLFNFR